MSERSTAILETREEFERRRAQYDHVIKTVCPMCPAGCGMDAFLKGGKVVGVDAMMEHPMGTICERGRAAVEWQYSPDRLTYPKRKTGEEWKRLSWDEALDLAANELTKIKEKYGPEALAIHMGNPFIDKSIDVITRIFTQAYGTPNFATGASYCNAVAVVSNRLTFGHVSNPNYSASKCIVLWGANPANSAPAAMMVIREQRKKGTKVIVVDPRVSETVKEGVDLHVRVKPGTDGALALALIKVILDEELYDKKFVDEWSIGFGNLPEAVKDYTPEKAEEITGIPAGTIREFARTYATVRPGCIMQGISPQHSINATQTNRAMAILMGITGNIDVPGGNMYVTKQGYKFPGVWEKLPPPKRISLKEHPYFVETYRQNSNNLVFHQMITGDPYPVKGLVVQGCNVMLTWPNTNKVKKALANLDFMMVIDVMENSTTKAADLVLPAATMFEKNEIHNYAGLALPMIGMTRKAVEPLGEAWPEFNIWTELGKRMGYEDWFRWNTHEEFLREILAPVEVEYDDVVEVPRGVFYGTKQNLKKYRRDGFATPSGKFEIFSERLASFGYDPLPTYTESPESPSSQPELAKDYPLILSVGSRIRYFTHAQHRNLASLREKYPDHFLQIHPLDAEKFGIKDGNEVRVETLRGSVVIQARVTEDVLPGCVNMEHGWEESNGNFLTDDERRDPIMGFTEFRVNLCQVSKGN